MTGRERVFAAVRGQAVDCCPVTPYNGNFCIHQSGIPMGDCHKDGKTLALAQRIGRDKTGQDVVIAQSEQYYICEALGVKTQLFSDQLPAVLDVPIKDLRDVAKLKVPDPYRDGRMYVYIEAVGLLKEHYQKEVTVRAAGTGPFALAGHLMGVENFIMAIALAEAEEDVASQALLLEMVGVCTDTLIRYTQACVEAGADIVQCGDSLASLNMISPSIYKKYAFPFEKRFFESVNTLKKDHDIVSLLHICGNNSRIAELLADTGCDILEVDTAIDLSDYRSRLGQKVCLMGNLNPAGALFRGTPEQVAEEARIAMDKAFVPGGRFCLGSGCEVAVEAPLENVKAMVETGHARKPEA